ncbi:MAG: hypothetical protein PWP66_508 [Thermosediminibacterales bacterium]|jgi:hypothetical protein|nr:hypothetical protein [Thermosediminibacterales bacterium]MDK2901713.1 hypothetical protein [Thermosediminibacterales bacterium]
MFNNKKMLIVLGVLAGALLIISANLYFNDRGEDSQISVMQEQEEVAADDKQSEKNKMKMKSQRRPRDNPQR